MPTKCKNLRPVLPLSIALPGWLQARSELCVYTQIQIQITSELQRAMQIVQSADLLQLITFEFSRQYYEMRALYR